MHRMEMRINLTVTNRVANLLDAVHPLVLLFSGGGRDAVEGVVALHYPSISFRLACFYHLVLVVGDEKLKAVLQVWIRQRLKTIVHTLTSRRRCTHRFLILHLFDAQVLQWDDPPGLFVLDKYENND